MADSCCKEFLSSGVEGLGRIGIQSSDGILQRIDAETGGEGEREQLSMTKLLIFN